MAMVDSVHVARWINLLNEQDWDLHIFSPYEAPPHPELTNVTVHCFSPFEGPSETLPVRWKAVWPFRRGKALAHLFLARQFPHVLDRVKWLAKVIRNIRPQLVHSLEIQHSSYLVLEARKLLQGQCPPWIVTNWGSDISLFGRLSSHRGKINAVLEHSEYYLCECERDVRLAKEAGFKGEIVKVPSNTGGLDLQDLARIRRNEPPSSRRLIVVKGYQGWSGRAIFALRALELCALYLRGYSVGIYVAGEDVEIAAELFSSTTGVPVEIIPKCSHDDMLAVFGRSRIYIGLGISDGISTSLLEAMSMGAFPIQSFTSCADEWIVDGETGFLVHPEDPNAIHQAIRRALEEDDLVDEAAYLNARVIADRLDRGVIRRSCVSITRESLRCAEKPHALGFDARFVALWDEGFRMSECSFGDAWKKLFLKKEDVRGVDLPNS